MYHASRSRVDTTLLTYGMVDESDTRLAAVDRPQCVAREPPSVRRRASARTASAVASARDLVVCLR